MYGRVEGGPFTFGGGYPYTPISQNEPLTSSIPGNDLAALIEGISSQLGAAAAAPQQAFGEAAAARLPGTWAFCLDVSGECCNELLLRSCSVHNQACIINTG
jgi:hypothetical protein